MLHKSSLLLNYHGQDVTQSQFFSRLKLVWIQYFPSSRLVTKQRLPFKNTQIKHYLIESCSFFSSLKLFQQLRRKTAYKSNIHLFIQLLHHGLYVTQGHFLSWVILVWIQFSSPRLVAIPRLKKPVCQINYPKLGEKRWIYVFSKGINTKWNANSLIKVWTQVNNSIFYNDNHSTLNLVQGFSKCSSDALLVTKIKYKNVTNYQCLIQLTWEKNL